MIVKESFRLVAGAKNLLDLPEGTLKSYELKENDPSHIYSFLDLKKRNLVHFTNPVIFDLVSNVKKRERIKVLTLDEYPLAVSYDRKTDDYIINLKMFGTKDLSNMNANDLYASLVYAYAFEKLVTKKFKINEDYAKIIVKYFLSFFVQMFGKEYGLVGIYSSAIPKLKFLLACYILSAFFGYDNNSQLILKASAIAPYRYYDELDKIKQYNFFRIEDFINSLSELKVMPGLTVAKFTSKIYRFLGINFLPAMEDCSRFFCTILTSTVGGSNIVPRYIIKYNEKEYYNLLDIIRGIFK